MPALNKSLLALNKSLPALNKNLLALNKSLLGLNKSLLALYFILMGSLFFGGFLLFSGVWSNLQKKDLYFLNQEGLTFHLRPTCKIGELPL